MIDMKRFLSTIILILLATPVLAAGPYLVCDPQPNIDYYIVTGLPAPIDGSRITPDASGVYGFKLDITTLPVGGPYTARAKACITTWGCSDDSLPFVFSRPASPSLPANIKLVP